MNNFIEQNVSLEKCPALVLNADYRPLSYYPLSLWSWQDTVKSVFLDRVTIVNNYDRVIRSPSFYMKLPSVIALKSYIKPHHGPMNLRLRIHLPLIVPSDTKPDAFSSKPQTKCGIRVGNQIRSWEEGKAVVLDDSQVFICLQKANK